MTCAEFEAIAREKALEAKREYESKEEQRRQEREQFLEARFQVLKEKLPLLQRKGEDFTLCGYTFWLKHIGWPDDYVLESNRWDGPYCYAGWVYDAKSFGQYLLRIEEYQNKKSKKRGFFARLFDDKPFYS